MERSGALKTPEEETRKAALRGPRGAPGGGFPRSHDRAARGSIAPHARSLATRELSRPTLAVIVRGRPAPELVFSLLSETIWGGKEAKELRRTRGGVGWGAGRVEMENLTGCSPSRSVRLLTFPTRGHRGPPRPGLARVGEGAPRPQAREEM